MVRLKDFYEGCKTGNISVVTEFISTQKHRNSLLVKISGNFLDSAEDGKRTGLLLAARHNHIICVKALVDAGASLYSRDEAGCTALHYAVWNANPEMVAYLLTEDGKQKSQLVSFASTGESSDGATALHIACQSNLPDIAAYLLRCNASPLVPNAAGQSPFDLACAGGHADTVAALLPAVRGCLAEVVSFTSCSPLEEAARGGHSTVVQQLLDAGFRVNARSGSGGAVGGTALHAACAGLRRQTVQLLLDSGANPQARDCSGRTAVDLLQSLGSQEHLRLAEDVACRVDLSGKSLGNPQHRAPPARPPPPRSLLAASTCGPDGGSGERATSPRPTPRRSIQEAPVPVAKRRSAVGNASALSASMQQGQQPSVKPRQRATIMLLAPSTAPAGSQPPKRPPPPPPHLRGLTFNESQEAEQPRATPAGDEDEDGLLISIDGAQAPLPAVAASSAASSSSSGIDLLSMSLTGVENLRQTAGSASSTAAAPPASRLSTVSGDLLLDPSSADSPYQQPWQPISIEPVAQPIADETAAEPASEPVYDEPRCHSPLVGVDTKAERDSQSISDETKSDSQPVADENKRDSQGISDETKRDSQGISDETKRDSQGISDETKRDSQGISDETKRDSQGISDETKRDSQVISDETKRDSQGISDKTKLDSQRISDETKRDSSGISDETMRDSQRISDETKRDSQRISDETKRDSQKISDETKRDSQKISDETQLDSQPGADETLKRDPHPAGSDTLKPEAEPVYDSPRRHSQPIADDLKLLLHRESYLPMPEPADAASGEQQSQPQPQQRPVPSSRGSHSRPPASSAALLLDLSSPSPDVVVRNAAASPDDSPVRAWEPLSIVRNSSSASGHPVVQPRASRGSRMTATTVSVSCRPLMQENERLGFKTECWPDPEPIGESIFYL